MSETWHLGDVPDLPQTQFLSTLVPALWQRPEVLGIWLEGSLARGNADLYSDVDLHVGVESSALEEWRALDVPQLFGDHYAAHAFSDFSEDFFVYHVYLTAGGIYDLHVQPPSRKLPQIHRLLLAWRDDEYQRALLAATPQSAEDASPIFAPQPLDPTAIAPLLVFFWINVDKGRKLLYRHQALTLYTGLHLFRHIAVRLHFMEQTGTDCGDLSRPTIHGLKAAALTLGQTLGADLGKWMGAPATTREEMYQAQSLIYDEVARVGRVLAQRYQIPYPEALEQIVLENWRKFATS